ncbi:hypothetical protein [Microvirga calopogonii]|nr:hypothetical protein [Microvirga calopogonii]
MAIRTLSASFEEAAGCPDHGVLDEGQEKKIHFLRESSDSQA